MTDALNMDTYPLRRPIDHSPKRTELLEWFRSNAPSLADAYEGAIRLVNDRSFPGRIHFISHAVRDLADRLVYVLDGDLKSERVQYEQHLDNIEKEWPQTLTVQSPEKVPPIQGKILKRLDLLINEHRQRRRRVPRSRLLFNTLMKNSPLQADRNERLSNDFEKLRKWFMDLTHLRSSTAPRVDETELQSYFEQFEAMLHSFVGNFFTGTKEIDDILRNANS